MRERARYSFQGCLIAWMPIIVSALASIATYYFMKSLAFHPFVIWTSVINIFWGVWALFYMLKKRLGEKS